MNISEILLDFPHCRLCNEEDNEIIINFLRTQTMRLGLLDLRYERGPDFFSFNKSISSDVYTLMMFEKDNRDIVGIGCIAKKHCYLDGKVMTYFYNSDLRIKRGLSQKLRTEWRLCHARIIAQLNESSAKDFPHNISPKFCAILDQNQKALIALTKKHDDLIFHPAKKYYSINILGKFKSLPKLTSSSCLAEFSNDDDQELTAFYQEERAKRSFAEVAPLQRSSVVIRDQDQKIVGMVSLKFQDSRKLIVTKMSTVFKFLSFLFSLIGFKPIKEEGPLNFLYLDNLIFKSTLNLKEKRLALLSVLQFIFNNKLNSTAHFICVPSFPEESLDKRLWLKGFLYYKVPGTLYQMIHKNNADSERRYEFGQSTLPLLNLSEL